MKAVRLRHLAHINPPTPEFDELRDDNLVTFHPLETVWADSRAERTRSVPKFSVASGYTRFRRGDVLVPKVTPTFQAGRAMLADELGAGTTELHILRARGSVDPRWLLYAVRSKDFLREGVTAFQGVAGLQRVPGDFVADFQVKDASVDEQRRIADFLDDRVARIDQIIAARTQERDQLLNARPSVLDECLEPFDAEWSTAVGRLVNVIDVRAGDHHLPLMRVSIKSGVTRRGDSTGMAEPEDTKHYKLVAKSDIVLNRMRAFQGAVGISPEVGIVSPDYLVMRAGPRVIPRWLDVVFRSPRFVGAMTERLRGIGNAALGTVRTPRVNWRDLATIPIPVPGIETQLGVADRVHRMQQSLVLASDRVARSIDLLNEYKQSLITAAVTGELDVTTAPRKIPGE